MPRPAERLLPAAYALLGLLADGPAHGYDLHRAFAPGTPLAEAYRLEINQLYALLKQLAERGLVEATGLAPVGNNPPRREFTLTVAGRAELTRWLAEPVTHLRDIRLEFLVKLYFAARRSPADARALLLEQRRVIRRRLTGLEETRATAALPTAFERLVLDLRVQQSLAILTWLDVALHGDPALGGLPAVPARLDLPVAHTGDLPHGEAGQ